MKLIRSLTATPQMWCQPRYIYPLPERGNNSVHAYNKKTYIQAKRDQIEKPKLDTLTFFFMIFTISCSTSRSWMCWWTLSPQFLTNVSRSCTESSDSHLTQKDFQIFMQTNYNQKPKRKSKLLKPQGNKQRCIPSGQEAGPLDYDL